MTHEFKKTKRHQTRLDTETYATEMRHLYAYAIELTSGTTEDQHDIEGLIFGVHTERDGKQHSPADLVAEGRTNEAMKMMKNVWEKRIDKINKYKQMLREKENRQIQTTKLFRNR